LDDEKILHFREKTGKKILHFREKVTKKILRFREFLPATTWAIAWFLQGHL
jgi:hypothetical protein